MLHALRKEPALTNIESNALRGVTAITAIAVVALVVCLAFAAAGSKVATVIASGIGFFVGVLVLIGALVILPSAIYWRAKGFPWACVRRKAARRWLAWVGSLPLSM